MNPQTGVGGQRGSPRILVIRLSAIGDIVFASPLVRALRRSYPSAHIAWLVQPECRALLEHHPALDEVIVWPLAEWRDLWYRRRWRALLDRLGTWRRELRARRFDMAIDLQGLMKSGLLTWLSGAPQRIGLGSREGSGWFMHRVVARAGDPRRIGSEYLFLAETLGLRVGDFAMEVHVSPADQRFAETLIARSGWGAGYAVICPFTTRPQKHWFEDRWGRLALALRAKLGLPVVMLGGPGDRVAAARIVQGAPQALHDLVGQTSLPQAAALIARSALMIGVDTGLSHMGIAFGRPSLLLFGSTCPYLNTTRANARVLYHRLPCSPCRRKPTCDGDFTCMKMIDVEEVLAEARALVRGAA